jgi:hypothetical protein
VKDKQTMVEDRRRRQRLSTRTNGWVFLGDDDYAPSREVIVTDVSRLGAGFICDTQLSEGAICRLRMGFGPRRLARRLRINHCREVENGFALGGEFV